MLSQWMFFYLEVVNTPSPSGVVLIANVTEGKKNVKWVAKSAHGVGWGGRYTLDIYE